MKTKPKREAVLMIIDRTGDSTTVGYKRFDIAKPAGMQALLELIRDAGSRETCFDVFKTYKKGVKK